MPSGDPLDRAGAKNALNHCIVEGLTVYSIHFREELANDELTVPEVLQVCRSGTIFMAPERDVKTGQWKYRNHRFREQAMIKNNVHECAVCGAQIELERRNYRYRESGISNIVLQGIEVAECSKCGNSDAIIPRVERVHLAIAKALADSPARLTGEQLRYLRMHLGLTGADLARYLHTDKTKVSKWERGEDRIGPATDRLMRLLTAALDKAMRSSVTSIAEHLQHVSDDPGTAWELYVDVSTLQHSFVKVSKAA